MTQKLPWLVRFTLVSVIVFLIVSSLNVTFPPIGTGSPLPNRIVGSLTGRAASLLQTPHHQEFTVSGTFTAPTGLTEILLSGCGGGGGGGTLGASAYLGSGGGGAGQSLFKQPVTVVSGAAYTVTNGAAGTASGDGGPSTFVGSGVSITLIGGSSGGVGTVGTTDQHVGMGGRGNPPGAAGLQFGVGDGNAQIVAPMGGTGASSPWGVGGYGSFKAIGGAASGYCSGGGGTSTGNAGTGYAGGVGTPGYWLVEYIQ